MHEVTTEPFATVWARQAMVASGHPIASHIGLATLAAGGTAVDAAIAMALATTVLLPDMCGLGGDAFALWQKGDGEPRAFLGSGKLPREFDETLLPAGVTLPLYGGAGVAVPGAVELYGRLHQAGGRLPWRDLVQPAVRLAQDGFPCDVRLHTMLVEGQSLIAGDPAVSRRFYPDGKPLAQGALVVLPEYAESLQEIQRGGPSAFYQGRMARWMVEAVERQGGFLRMEDLAAHHGEECEPLSVTFKGYTVYETPLPTPGFVLLEALKILETEDIGPDWQERPDIVHRVIEALKWSFRDRRDYAGDPDFVAFDPRRLLTPQWIQARRAAISAQSATIPTSLTAGDTTSLVAVDSEGNAVSFIHSLAMAFGSGVYVAPAGYFMNNRASRSFNRVPGHPNQARPGKRPMHTLNTYLVTEGGRLYAVGNTPGGDGQMQWNLSILLDILCGGRLPHEAVSRPRLTIAPATDAHVLNQRTEVSLESRFSPSVVDDLRRRGHQVKIIGPYAGGGSAQLIIRGPGGWAGASDPRNIGQTQGY